MVAPVEILTAAVTRMRQVEDGEHRGHLLSALIALLPEEEMVKMVQHLLEDEGLLEELNLPYLQQLRIEALTKGLTEGISKGLSEGMTRGRAEGRREGETEMLLHLLRLRFGPLPVEIEVRVTAADAETLLRWSERVLTASSLEAVFARGGPGWRSLFCEGPRAEEGGGGGGLGGWGRKRKATRTPAHKPQVLPTHMYRRTFLTRSAAALIFALGLAPHRANAEPIPLSKSFTHANFTAYVGQSFYVYGGEKGLRKVISVEIIEVSERKPESKTEQFFVRFRGPHVPVLSKSVYTLEHPATADKFQLFLEPANADSRGQYYYAVFNLLR